MDYDFKVQRQRDFQNTLLTELTVPELSAASKDAAAAVNDL